MYCKKCGTELVEGASFCAKCGTAVGVLPPVAPPVAGAQAAMRAPARAPRPSAAQAAYRTPSAQPGYVSASAPTNQDAALAQPRRRSAPLIAALLCLLVVVGVGIGIYFAFFAPYAIDEKVFPDPVFRSYVSTQLDSDRDGKLSRQEAKETSIVSLSGTAIADLGGIEKLPNVATLDLANTSRLSEADLSVLPKLEFLDISNSAIRSINLESNSDLSTLRAQNTHLASLDLSANTHLENLDLSGSQSSSISLPSKSDLSSLNISSSTVGVLDLSGAKHLKDLRADNTPLRSLDLSVCEELESFSARESTLQELILGGKGTLTRVDVSHTQLSTLDASGYSALENLYAYSSNLASINVGGCGALESLDVSGTRIVDLDTSGCASLSFLDTSDSALERLNVEGCTSLVGLNVDDTVVLSGLESAGLKEQWLLVGLETQGYDQSSIESFGPTSIQPPLEMQYSFSYDSMNRLSRKSVTRTYTGSVDNTTVYTYSYDDDASTFPSELELSGSGGSSTFTYTYNDGVLTGCESQIGSWSRKHTYEYDDNGNLIKENNLNSLTGGDMTFEYSNGILARTVASFDDDTTKETVVFAHNDLGQLTGFDISYSSDYQSWNGKMTYEYDGAGQCIKMIRTYAVPDTFLSTQTYEFTYDENGRIVKTTCSEENDGRAGDTREVACTYDSHGNRVAYDGSSSTFDPWTRTYTYRRVIIPLDAPDVRSPLIDGNPLTLDYEADMAFDLKLFEDQNPIVKNTLYSLYGSILGMN